MRFSARKMLTIGAVAGSAVALGAATLPPILSGSGGLWEVSRSATGAGAQKVCVPNSAALAQWEHRGKQCTPTVISSTDEEAVIRYTCRGKDFGQSTVRVVTPRTLRIDTQGISGGYPFAYVLHARRAGNC